jgi:hypothetical protein
MPEPKVEVGDLVWGCAASRARLAGIESYLPVGTNCSFATGQDVFKDFLERAPVLLGPF